MVWNLNPSLAPGGFHGNIVGLTVGNTLPDANLTPEFVTSYEVGGEFNYSTTA